MSEQKKRNNKESTIYLMLQPSQKIFERIGVYLWPPSNPELNPLDYAIWGVLENKINATSYPNIPAIEEK